MARILPEKWLDGFAAEQFDLVKGLVANIPEAVMITSAEPGEFNPPIMHINPAFTALTGYTAEDIVGKTPKILQGPRTEKEVLDRLKTDLAEKEAFEGRTWNYRKDGSEFIMEWEIVSFYDARGKISFYMTIQREAAA